MGFETDTADSTAESTAHLGVHAQRVQAAVDAIHDGVFIFDAASLCFIHVNAGAVVLTGYPYDELMTMTPLDLAPEFTVETFTELLAPLIARHHDVADLQTVLRTSDRVDVPVHVMLQYPPMSDGVAPVFVAVVRDMSERLEMLEQLAISEQTFRASFEHAPVGMVVVRLDEDGTAVVERANEAFAAFLDRPLPELIGRDILTLAHPDDAAADRRALTQMRDGLREQFTTEMRYRRVDGAYVWSLLHATVLSRDDTTRSLAHVVDISDRRAQQNERARRARLRDRERIGRDLHDIVIQRLFAAGMRLQSALPGSDRRPTAELIGDTIDELDGAIRDLRATIFELSVSDATSPIDDLDAAVQSQVAALGFRPEMEVVGDLVHVKGIIVAQLVPAVREALANVARHAEASHAAVRVSVDDTHVTLEVIDDGRGIDEHRVQGRGLINLAQRASRLGGTSAVSARGSGGTQLVWRVPR